VSTSLLVRPTTTRIPDVPDRGTRTENRPDEGILVDTTVTQRFFFRTCVFAIAAVHREAVHDLRNADGTRAVTRIFCPTVRIAIRGPGVGGLQSLVRTNNSLSVPRRVA
jgi:hypothetical protein